MVARGQIWTLLRGSSQHRILIVSNDEYNAVEHPDLAVAALIVVRAAITANPLAVRLADRDPLSGAHVLADRMVQVLDRTALRETHGFVSHATMVNVETALREFLELP
ncbi:type II toxin-antitoxin system PemK/MazF family toxin [Actinoplanes sp. CA-054009]